MVREERTYEDWEILDSRFVGGWGEGLLYWWLVLEEASPRGVWRPFITALDGKTVLKWPSWAPLPGSQQQFLTSPVFETLFCGPRGTGKALMSYEPVLTPYGWRAIGLLQQGDAICATDGTITTVEDVFPQGPRECYAVEFDDGSLVKCDGDHKWAVSVGWGAAARERVLTTLEIVPLIPRKVYTPTCAAVEFAAVNEPRVIEPYLMGLMLGDGSMTQQIRFTTMDKELADYVTSHGFEYQGNNGSKASSYNISGKSAIAREFERLNVRYKRAHEKSVPQSYLRGSREDRLAVLQGLLDTDGTADKRHCSFAEFASTSEQLANDVMFLAASLGGKASVSSKIPTLNGVPCRRSYTVHIQPGNKFIPFRLSRKVAKLTRYKPTLKRRIVSVTPIGVKDATCITVSHPSGLFITRDFVVTHNSEMLLMDFAKEVGRGFESNWRGILFRQQLGDLDEMVRKTETLFKPIFPGFHFKLSKADYAACWPSGEQLLFRHMIDETEYKEYHGHQYPWVGWEEITQWSDLKAYKLMFSCCRPTASGVPTRVRANTNPSGPGHNVVKKRFQLPGMFGKIIREPNEEPRVAIQSSLKENFVLLHDTPNYSSRVRSAALSSAQADAWATGNWDVTEGGMIDDIWRAPIHVIPNIVSRQIPPGWQFSRSYDHGQAKPFSVLWWAESNGEPIRLPDGRYIGQIPGDLVLFMEWYGTNGQEDTGLRMASTKIAQGIKDREKDNGINHRVIGGPADTEIWSKSNQGTGRAPIDDFQDRNVFWDQADKSSGSRKRGWGMLRERVAGSVPNFDGTREKPGIFVCVRCKYWLELVPTMPRALDDPDDIPKTYEDHCGDSTRYRLSWEFLGMKRRNF